VPEASYKVPYGAQATVARHFRRAKAGLDFFKPVKPNTIAKSLAGTPADGFYALRVMRGNRRGTAGNVTDDEIREVLKCRRMRRAPARDRR